jgi:hypothetical protein
VTYHNRTKETEQLHDGIGELYEVKASHVAEDANRLEEEINVK